MENRQLRIERALEKLIDEKRYIISKIISKIRREKLVYLKDKRYFLKTDILKAV
jgi:hypothetical protein